MLTVDIFMAYSERSGFPSGLPAPDFTSNELGLSGWRMRPQRPISCPILNAVKCLFIGSIGVLYINTRLL